MRVAVLDLGSNSFQLVVADVDDVDLTIVTRDREMLRLGAAVAATGEIPPDLADAAVHVVDRFRRAAVLAGAELIVPVATSAIRDAANRSEIVLRLAAAAGADVGVLDGSTEARLALKGMRHGVPVAQWPVVGLDLGGGSLDLAVGSRSGCPFAASMPLGVVRLHEELGGPDLLDRSARRLLTDRIDTHLRPVAAEAKRAGPRAIVACGGAVRALARLLLAEPGQWTPPSAHGAVISAVEIEAMADRLAATTGDDRLALPGMDRARADVVPIGAFVLAAALDELDADSVVISDWGLREGVLLDAARLHEAPQPATVREATVARLLADWNADTAHADQVAMLAAQLFDQTRRRHGLGLRERELLRHGARLHDIGTRGSEGSHHKRGAYLVEQATLRGFSPEEAAMLATLVRFHKGADPKPAYEPYATLGTEARDTVQVLCALLRVADGLDRGHEQCVTGVRVVPAPTVLTLEIQGPGDVELARWAADQKAALLADVLRTRVRVRTAGRADADDVVTLSSRARPVRGRS